MSLAHHLPSAGAGQTEDLPGAMEGYRRLASMDPPAMRSLAAELTRISRESAAAAIEQGTAEAAAWAGRHAQRAAAAQAAMAALEAADEGEGTS